CVWIVRARPGSHPALPSFPTRRPSDLVVLEAAQHMHDGIDLADVGEELVAQPFSLGRASDEAGDIDKGDAGRDDFLRSCRRRDLDRKSTRVNSSHVTTSYAVFSSNIST